jgi:hypothetical protein
VVLILVRFTDERKTVLDALREELRKRDYLPIQFDFVVPATRDITETTAHERAYRGRKPSYSRKQLESGYAMLGKSATVEAAFGYGDRLMGAE